MVATKKNLAVRIIAWVAISLFCLTTLASVFLLASPLPTAWLTRALFSTTSYPVSDDFEVRKAQTQIVSDIDYGSKYKNGILDIISPKEKTQNLPVIFWMHGGAYVAGDKSDVKDYLILIASENYIIVNFNYALAPSEKYPAQLIQITEVFKFISKNAAEYGIDMDKVFSEATRLARR